MATGLTVAQAKGIMNKYLAAPLPTYPGIYNGTYGGSPVAHSNCTLFSQWFLKTYTTSNVNLAIPSGNGKQMAQNFVNANSGKFSISGTPKAFSLFSISGNNSQYGTYDAGHTGIVLGIDGNNVITGEANYGFNYGGLDGAYPNIGTIVKIRPLSTFNSSTGVTFVYLDNYLVNELENNRTPPTSGDSVPASGVYKFTAKGSVKNEPKVSSPELASYDIGQTVNYDSTVKADGYLWISYISGSGVRRYIAVQKLASIPQNGQPIYRVYNKNTGEHFYTSNQTEEKNLVNSGWEDEGIGWYAPKTGEPVFRLYNKNNGGDHVYTVSESERDNLVRAGWKYECIAFYSSKDKQTPLYRLYNPNAKSGSHHYTLSKTERDNLVSAGWKYEGIARYGL